MTANLHETDSIDGPHAWLRLVISLILSIVGGISLWSAVVVLPAIEAEFVIDRGDASIPYFATVGGFAIGGIFIGRITDRYGITTPLLFSTVMLGVGYFLVATAESLWEFVALQAIFIGMLTRI